MTDRGSPKCPMGHEMELLQVASGGWRYGCAKCATSYKVQKKAHYGWLSPIKSTKERAYEAAVIRPMQKLIAKVSINPLEICEQCPNFIFEDVQAYIQRLERERDAAVKDLSLNSRCAVCKKFFKNGGDCSGGTFCIPLRFEWRGVPIKEEKP